MSARLASCALTSLTRRLGGLNLGAATITASCKNPSCLSLGSLSSYTTVGFNRLLLPKSTAITMNDAVYGNNVLPVLGSLNAIDGPFWQMNRSVTRKKRLARRLKRKLAVKAEERKLAAKEATGEVPQADEAAAPQHEAWVDFQKSISVQGFQTGQTTKARVQQKGESGQKLRDLKRKEKLDMRLAAKRPELADIKGGMFPTKRYSDEETERLLKMAFAALPKRTGKRGTRNLQRQENRWFLVRKIHRKKKRQMYEAHLRRMQERSKRMREIREGKAEAPDIRARDREYQRQVLQRWVQIHSGDFQEQTTIQADVMESKTVKAKMLK